MKILIACIHYPVASGRYIQRALRRLGHDVRTVGQSTGNQIWGMQVKDEWVWEPEFPDGDWLPDLVITAESAFGYTSPRLPDVPYVVWGVDNHVRDYFPEVPYDALFLAHSWGARMGEPNVHWLPCAYDPAAHCDLGIERDIDVVMVGVAYPERVTIMNALNAAGINAVGGTGLLWDDYNHLYNRAKIALVKSVNGDLAQRFFENMAQGCCVLADKTVDADKLLFNDTYHYWSYDDVADCVEQAKALLHSGAWRDVAERGKRKVQGHTWDARALQLLETLFTPEQINQEPIWSHT